MSYTFPLLKRNLCACAEAVSSANALLVMFFVLLLAQSQLQAQAANNSIKIGFSIIASDPAGQPVLKAVRMAVDEINTAGGVLGKPLELVVTYNPTKDYTKVPGIINGMIKKGVMSILTSGGSAMTLKATEITIPQGILVMTASSTSPKITDLKDNGLVWRTIPSDVFQGKLAAALVDSLRAKNVGVIYVNNAYGNGLFKVFKEELEARSGKVVSAVNYAEQPNYQAVDFKPLLKTLFKDKPQAIYLITYGEDGGQIITQAAQEHYLGASGYKPLMMACDANYNNDLLLGCSDPKLIEGMIGLVYTHPKKYDNYNKFFAAYKVYEPVSDSADIANASLSALLNIEATAAYAATAYDAVYTLAFAMLRANSAESGVVAKHLFHISRATPGAEPINVKEFAKAAALLKQGKTINYDGASGALEFDANGDVTSGSYAIWHIINGNFEETSTLETKNILHKGHKK